jgi:hypothetical protein
MSEKREIRTTVEVHHATGTVTLESHEAVERYGSDIPALEVTNRLLDEHQARSLAEMLLSEHGAVP